MFHVISEKKVKVDNTFDDGSTLVIMKKQKTL